MTDTLPGLISWLNDNSEDWLVIKNPHEQNHETIDEYLKWREDTFGEENVRAQFVGAEEFWVGWVYPDSPGSNLVTHATSQLQIMQNLRDLVKEGRE